MKYFLIASAIISNVSLIMLLHSSNYHQNFPRLRGLTNPSAQAGCDAETSSA